MPRIAKVEIRLSDSPFGNRAAWIWFTDEDISTSPRLAFHWFDDQIYFNESELIGLTLQEAHALRHSKNSRVKNSRGFHPL